jgi:hypothetical protein
MFKVVRYYVVRRGFVSASAYGKVLLTQEVEKS